MKVTTKGQVTIPQHVRKFLGISPYSEVDFAICGTDVHLVKIEDTMPDMRAGRFRKLRGLKRGEWTTADWMKATRGD